MIAKRSLSDREETEDKPVARVERPRPADLLISQEAPESPARVLQQSLASRIGDGLAVDAEDSVERWPRRQRLIFLICAASALWGATIGLAMISTEIIGFLRS